MISRRDAALRLRIAKILGLETSPEGESECLVLRYGNTVVQWTDFSDVVDALVELVKETSDER